MSKKKISVDIKVQSPDGQFHWLDIKEWSKHKLFEQLLMEGKSSKEAKEILDFMEKQEGLKLNLSEEQEQLIQTGSAIDEKYFFLPFWFEKVEDGSYKIHSLGNLPEELKQKIKSMRMTTTGRDKDKI